MLTRNEVRALIVAGVVFTVGGVQIDAWQKAVTLNRAVQRLIKSQALIKSKAFVSISDV